MTRLLWTLLLASASLGGAGPLAAASGLSPESESCLACHGGKDSGPPFIDARLFALSPHGGKSCSFCHADVKEFPHPSPVKKVDCGACHAGPREKLKAGVHGKLFASRKDGPQNACVACHGHHDIRPAGEPSSRIAAANIVKTCGRCHAVEAKKFAASVHGRASARGVRAAPNCIDCHGEHDIRAPGEVGSRVARAERAKACADCHRSARLSSRFGDRVQSFQASFHGMAGKGGDVAVADCASCHGWHDVQPSSDARSRTNSSNLARTCGQCHEGAGKRWGGGRFKVHDALAQQGGGSRLAAFVAGLYGFAIPMTVLGMLFHNGLDLSRKMRGPRGRRHRLEETPLSRPERWQHAANGACFLLLAYSGFALHDPLAWWARPFQLLGGEAARRNAHRAAAALFLMTAAAHLAYLNTQRGRARLRSMLPAWRDLKDPVKVLSYNAGASMERPRLAQFCYVEKFEYWALVWGSFVMTMTGGLLLFHNLALAWLPLWMTETARVAHYLEAVLACLAILIWHGYWVFFDPEVYPMNWAWLTGETYLPDDTQDKER